MYFTCYGVYFFLAQDEFKFSVTLWTKVETRPFEIEYTHVALR